MKVILYCPREIYPVLFTIFVFECNIKLIRIHDPDPPMNE